LSTPDILSWYIKICVTWIVNAAVEFLTYCLHHKKATLKVLSKNKIIKILSEKPNKKPSIFFLKNQVLPAPKGRHGP